MKEELIKLETAILAKEKGFDIFVKMCYAQLDKELYSVILDNHNTYDGKYSAPTQSLLQKWIREIHKIDVIVLPYDNIPIDYKCYIYKHLEDNKLDRFIMSREYSYEQALEKGLIYSLNLIK